MSFRKNSHVAQIAAVAAFVLCSTVTAYGSGFEKSVSWSGRWNGVAGAATGAVTGGESLFFNPAGLAGGAKSDVSLNISPTLSQFKAPIGTAGAEVESKQQLSPVYGALASYRLSDKLALGLGSYIGGGSKVFYENVRDEALNDYKSDLSLNEIALGAAYEISPGLRIGASYRVNMVNANLISPSRLPVALGGALFAQTRFEDMSQTNFEGYRAGIQYAGSGWGVGAMYRSKVEFNLEGDVTHQTNTVGAAGISEGSKTVKGNLSSELPQQLAVGGWFDAMTNLRTYIDYSLTHYANVSRIGTTAPFAGQLGAQYAGGDANPVLAGSAGFLAGVNAGLAANWMNQHVGRIGFEYTGMANMPIRLGYAMTSRVTPKANATPTFTPPGVGNDFTLGTGYNFSDALAANLALNYGFNSDDSEAPAAPGKYSASAYIAHVGLNYSF